MSTPFSVVMACVLSVHLPHRCGRERIATASAPTDR
jgi:hypothetical protein